MSTSRYRPNHPRSVEEAIAQTLSRHRIGRRSFLGGAAALTGAAALGAARPRRAHAQDAEIVFTYWGSPQEQDAVAAMTEDFNDQHENISVKPQYIPNDGYDEKLTTMLASDTLPDVAYMGAGQAFSFASQGAMLDLAPYVNADAETGTLVPNTTYVYDEGKVLSTSLAIGIFLSYYNKKLFESAGVALPPSKAAEAWQWNDFLEIAKRLTKDRSGRDATDPEFDAENIDVYGVTFQKFVEGYMSYVGSNGGSFANPEGTELLLNRPESVEVFQALQDLIHVHHVSPTPAQSDALPATDVLLRTGKVAIDLNGMWKVLDYSQHDDLDWGVGVLPYFKQPVTTRFGIPIVVSAKTKDPAATYEFYRWRYSPERIDLYRKGLWMPIQQDYYTDEAKIAAWLDAEEGVFPPESRDVFIDYALNYAAPQPPGYWLKNLSQIMNDAVEPALDLIWTGEKPAQAALDEAVANAAPLLQGVYQTPV